jgi:hypothetical protein
MSGIHQMPANGLFRAQSLMARKGTTMRFKKRPVEVDAVLWDGDERLFDYIMGWCTDQSRTFSMSNGSLYIATLEGEMRADKGDWIIRGVKGEVYPCKPDIFEKTYEPA